MSAPSSHNPSQMQHHQHVRRRGVELAQHVLQPLLSRVQSDKTPLISHLVRSIHDVEQVARRGPPLSMTDLPAFMDAIRNDQGGIDDRQFLLEKVLVLLSRLPDDSIFAEKAQRTLIALLYKDLPHPPTGFLSTFKTCLSLGPAEGAVSYAVRSADGSNYNVLLPSIGQAGQPYARSVPSTHIPPHSMLPDPGLVFDTLLRRPAGDFVPHPGGLSSLFFAFADLIIHSIFNTNILNWSINDASSYLDLSIIYGNSEEPVDKLRRKDGSGKIWNDTFADSRLLFMPPSVCALAVLFSRHHNYIADKILTINERGHYQNPPPKQKMACLAQCDEIFHRARLVNTAFFVQVILADYVGNILGLVRDGLTWRLNPLESFREPDHAVSPRGEGNAVSIEFNLLYRWHASISAEDEKWLDKLFSQLLEGKDPDKVSIADFREIVRGKVTPQSEVQTWTFDGLERGSDGSFSDKDLARILLDATERRAGAFRARGCPAVLRVVEILAMEQARTWGACTLNEFRKFMGLKPYASFREWNPDPKIYLAAEKLYGDIENLELHVGLQAEETKWPMPGAGLCPGFTISRAILADAVCLTRGDRFLTVDFTPYNLTSWGYNHCMVNKADGSYGGMLTKLLFRLLPNHYPARSVYAHFPFTTPDFMLPYIASREWEKIHDYEWERPGETAGHDTQRVRTLGDIYEKRLEALTTGVVVTYIQEVRVRIQRESISSISFSKMAQNLIKKSSSDDGAVRSLDVVKDVLNHVSVHWAANFVLGLPITPVDSAWGGHSVQQWYQLFADVARYLYFNDDVAYDWTLREKAVKATNEIMYYLHARLTRLNDGIVSLAGACDLVRSSILTSNIHNDGLLTNILLEGKQWDLNNIAYTMFEETVPSTVLFSAVLASVVNYYSHASQERELQKLVELCTDTTRNPKDDILAFINRALAKAARNYQLGQGVPVRNGPPLPCLVIGNREMRAQWQKGLLSRDIFSTVAPDIIKAVFSLKNVRFPVPGMQSDDGIPASKLIEYDV
ncbi:heme peroxidase [Phlebopus sp. FC_14]|nr:heme peroxidase [Phlebopus sp. FC_14]